VKKEIIIGAVSALVVAILVTAAYAVAFLTGFARLTTDAPGIGTDAAKEKIESFVRDNLVQPGTELSVKDVTEKSGLYSATLTVQGTDYPVYLSFDGALLFPEAIETTTPEADASTPDAGTTAEVPKSQRPKVELFVMSYCPYGTQIEKGILPVLETLGDSIDFELKFVSYAMHDKKEIDENLRQYCIRTTEDSSKLYAYLGCFLSKGEGTEDACLKTAGISAAKNAACMKEADEKFEVMKKYADKSTYQGSFPPFDVDKEANDTYGVQGSPTLVINGVEAPSSGRDAASLLSTICSAFETSPDACSATLSSETPAPGFGDGTATGASEGSCG